MDSLKYPFSDWKKLLILGIILIITDSAYISLNFGKNVYLLVLLIGIAFLVGFLVNGYLFRIIKMSLDREVGLPEFKNWVDMSVKGAKIYLVFFVYIIPVIILISLNAPSYHWIIPNEYINAFSSVFWQGIGNFWYLNGLFGLGLVRASGIFIGTLYLTIITPIMFVAIANMAFYDGSLKSAFKIRDILEEISLIGWGNLIKWYILTAIIFIIFSNISFILFYLSDMINHIIGEIINSLIICSYLSLFLARSIGLFYMPEEED